MDPEVPLVELSEHDVVEVDRPDPVVGFLEADVLLFEGLAEKELMRVPAKAA